MGLSDDLSGKLVGIDSAPLIYYIEEHPQYTSILDPAFEAVAGGKIRLVASTIVLAEVLVHPIRAGDEALSQKYYDILIGSENIDIFPVTAAVAQIAAELRAERQLKSPDAIQLATAIHCGAEAFLTNDRDFPDGLGIEIHRLRDYRT
jgi:predicted nucleic acid-binding protein